ncbi:MAG: hypothetical protein ACQESJ_03690 [Bacteroidota bacterium]
MSKDKHLTYEEIAQCADAINEGNYDNLPSSLREHLSNCEYCVSEVMMVSDVSQDIEHELAQDKKKDKRFRIKHWYIGAISVAAAAVILFFIVPSIDTGQNNMNEPGLAQEFKSIPVIIIDDEEDTAYFKEDYKPQIASMPEEETPEEKKSVEAEQDVSEKSLQEVNKKEMLAEYKPDDSLEQLYENMKGAYRSRDITVNTSHTITYENKDSLRWENPKKKKLYVEFFNNEGEEIKTLVVDDNQVPIPEFSDGLYYWKLVNEDFDLLFVGKILVE